MTEYEMAASLGITTDPDRNKLELSRREISQEVHRIIRIFKMAKEQKGMFGNVNIERWADLIPCYSNN